MARRAPKTKIVAFKVEEELADFLNKLPNKSDYIRKAIVAQFGMACPLCTGTGVVARGLHNHYKPVIEEHNTHPCQKCKKPVSFPLSMEAVPEEDRVRFEQFYQGGPIYCLKCYPDIPECDDCGWHIPHDHIADHIRKQHAHG